MQLHQLKGQFKNKLKKRVGRGGKRGTTSGRGTKGQKSRSGHRIRPAERDLIQRLPKLKGLKNKSLVAKPIVINVGDLEKKVKGGIINKDILIKAGLIRKSDWRIKILGDGELKQSFQIEGLEVSQSARKKIEAAGGNVK